MVIRKGFNKRYNLHASKRQKCYEDLTKWVSILFVTDSKNMRKEFFHLHRENQKKLRTLYAHMFICVRYFTQKFFDSLRNF